MDEGIFEGLPYGNNKLFNLLRTLRRLEHEDNLRDVYTYGIRMIYPGSITRNIEFNNPVRNSQVVVQAPIQLPNHFEINNPVRGRQVVQAPVQLSDHSEMSSSEIEESGSIIFGFENVREIADERQEGMGNYEVVFYIDNNEHKNCTICLEDFVIGEPVIRLACFHLYHSQCIKGWENSGKNNCPECRNPF